MKIKIIFLIILILVVGLSFYLFLWPKIPSLANKVVNLKNQLVENEKNSFSFFVFGDNEGDNNVFQKIIKRARESDAKFVIDTGDLTPSSKEDEFNSVKKRFEQLKIPYYTAVGNNDIFGDKERNLYKKYFGQTYYSFDYRDTHFIILDNADRKTGFEDNQLEWLKNDLNNNKKKYSLIIYHRPFNLPFSQLTGDDETTASRKSNQKFIEILKIHKIDQIYNGHLHLYFTYNLEGIPVIITGGAGAKPQSVLGGEESANYHYIKVTVGGDAVENELINL
jgi:predicted phosphodiesterase